MSPLNAALLSTIAALDALDRDPPNLRRYPSVPEADDEESTPEAFHRQVERDRNWRDAEQFFLDEQCPSDGQFR
jgi:hypothetical protein